IADIISDLLPGVTLINSGAAAAAEIAALPGAAGNRRRPTGAWILANPAGTVCPAHKTADFGAKMRLRCDFGRENRPPSSAVRENHPTCTLHTG
ncbi:MAG: hypothetical protein EGQ82_00625, partial [Clostridiales bacterium]|nr:hypothetical protein [Clostridiales bacterium]